MFLWNLIAALVNVSNSSLGEKTEDALVEALIKFDVQKIMDIIITDILANGDVSTAKILSEVFKKFGDTFRDPEDVNILMGLLTDEVIQRNLGALSKTISSIEPKHIEGKTSSHTKYKMSYVFYCCWFLSNNYGLLYFF